MELIKVENDTALLDVNVSNKIAEFERQAKTIAEQESALKEQILKEMEEKGIIKIETDNLTINYYSPSDRETFNKDRLREEHPDLYDEYISMTPVKSSIRIKVK